MQKIQAVAFDVDNVLVNIDIPRIRERLAQDFPYVEQDPLNRFFEEKFRDCADGKIDTKESLTPYLEEMGWAGTADDYLEYWHRSQAIVDFRLVRFAQKLRKEGIICCVTTNNDPYRTKYLRENMHFDEWFDHGFYQSEIGIGKPHKEFYDHITSALQVDPSETVLIDDRQKYLDGAADCGWQTILYTSFEEFEKEFSQKFS